MKFLIAACALFVSSVAAAQEYPVKPARTPATIVERLHRELTKALAAPDVREKLISQGFEIVGSTPQAFTAFVAAESDKWAKVVREHAIRAD